MTANVIAALMALRIGLHLSALILTLLIMREWRPGVDFWPVGHTLCFLIGFYAIYAGVSAAWGLLMGIESRATPLFNPITLLVFWVFVDFRLARALRIMRRIGRGEAVTVRYGEQWQPSLVVDTFTLRWSVTLRPVVATREGGDSPCM